MKLSVQHNITTTATFAITADGVNFIYLNKFEAEKLYKEIAEFLSTESIHTHNVPITE